MDDQSYFTVDGNAMSGNSKFLMSLKSEVTENVKFIRKTVFPAKVLLWLAVSESVIGRPVLQSTKKCTYPNVYQYVINLSKSPQKQKIVFWPDLASAHYSKDTLVQLEALKIEYIPKE
jgi:hypothetical protein